MDFLFALEIDGAHPLSKRLLTTQN